MEYSKGGRVERDKKMNTSKLRWIDRIFGGRVEFGRGRVEVDLEGLADR
jgi:hypothetical protein